MTNPFVKYLFVSLVSAWVFCLDQASKSLIQTQFNLGDTKTVIDGAFNIFYITNSGGAFGLFNESHEIIRFILFLLLPIVCVILVAMMLRETQDRLQILALSFIIGGAGGNYFDRARLGYVVDFIDWHVKDWHWPTFNIADSFIVMGVCILLFFYIRDMRDVKSRIKPAGSADTA